MRYNIIKNVGTGAQLAGDTGDVFAQMPTTNIYVHNNLFYNP